MCNSGKVAFFLATFFFAVNASADPYAKIGGAYGWGYRPSDSSDPLHGAGLDVHAGVNKDRIDLEFNYLYLQGFKYSRSIERTDTAGSYIANEAHESKLQGYIGAMNFRILNKGNFQPYATFGAGVMMVQNTASVTESGRVARYLINNDTMKSCTKAGGGFSWKMSENLSFYGESALWSGPIRFFTGQLGFILKP